MKVYLLFLAIAWFTARCQAGADSFPTPTPFHPSAPPGMGDHPASSTPTVFDLPPRPDPSPQPGEVEAAKENFPETPIDAWDTGGPGKIPKPNMDLAVPQTPQYLDQIEAYSPFQQSPQLPELPTQPPAAQPHLPDLYTLPPYDLRLVRDLSSGREIVRFSNAIANLGPGAVELRGMMDNNTQIVDVSQRIFTSLTGEDITYEENGVGHFHYHDEHEHWHWDGFSLYEVYAVLPDSSLGELIYSSDKVGYCLRDDRRVDELIENNPSQSPTQERRYQGCSPTIQGLSSGWADVYAHDTPGQWVDVTGLPEGEIFALRSTANPYNLIHELDPANNSAVIFFRLQGTGVEQVELGQLADPNNINE